MITLIQWAKNHGIKPDTARQWANRGRLSTAVRLGRDWMIDEKEKLPEDKRKGAR